MKCYASIVFGLIVIWTGILRSIEAHAFKPNAFWFCWVMGLIAIAGAYFMRLGRRRFGTQLGVFAALVTLVFYVNCLVTQPEKDASYRVGIVIVAAVAQLALILLPQQRDEIPSP